MFEFWIVITDDTNICSSHELDYEIVSKVQLAINIISAYLSKWKIKSNAEQTQTLFFTHERNLRVFSYHRLTIESQGIPFSDHIKYVAI